MIPTPLRRPWSREPQPMYATTAAAGAERARQLAVGEAQQSRGDAKRTNAELVAARQEIDRVKAANGGLERQIAALGAESKSAMDTARQTLALIDEIQGFPRHLSQHVGGFIITEGRLDFGPWEQIFYGEFDGRRRKRVLVKIIGE